MHRRRTGISVTKKRTQVSKAHKMQKKLMQGDCGKPWKAYIRIQLIANGSVYL